MVSLRVFEENREVTQKIHLTRDQEIILGSLWLEIAVCL